MTAGRSRLDAELERVRAGLTRAGVDPACQAGLAWGIREDWLAAVLGRHTAESLEDYAARKGEDRRLKGGTDMPHTEPPARTRAAAARAAAAGTNRRRHGDAAARDVPLAQAITLSPVWAELDEPRRQVVAVRAGHPDATWSEIAGITGMTKDTAYGLWRRVRRLPQVQTIATREDNG